MYKPLSLAAKAVYDAATIAAIRDNADWPVTIAAALRAAVDQVLPEMDEPDWGGCEYMRCDIELYADHQRKRREFLAIAAELENTDA